MPLPLAWVDRIFAKLTVRYGAAFMRQYADLDIALVKADWAEVLDGFDALDGSIGYAMRYLPSDRPPSALTFRDICRRAPEPALDRLPPPDAPKADPQRVAAVMDGMRAGAATRASMSRAEWCARTIRRIVVSELEGVMSSAQRAQLIACERVCGDTSQPRADGIAP